MRHSTGRRGFLQTSILSLTGLVGWTHRPDRHQLTVDERWLDGLTGRHKAFFDVDAIRDGILGRVDNFLNVYRDDYGLRDSDLNVVFGAHGAGLGFVLNDSMWSKYQLGDVYTVRDPRSGRAATRNIFMSADAAYRWPADYSIGMLQSRGVRFLACRGTMHNLSRQLASLFPANTEGSIFKELELNLIKDAIPVPAMIVAQNRAQEVGLRYVYVV